MDPLDPVGPSAPSTSLGQDGRAPPPTSACRRPPPTPRRGAKPAAPPPLPSFIQPPPPPPLPKPVHHRHQWRRLRPSVVRLPPFASTHIKSARDCASLHTTHHHLPLLLTHTGAPPPGHSIIVAARHRPDASPPPILRYLVSPSSAPWLAPLSIRAAEGQARVSSGRPSTTGPWWTEPGAVHGPVDRVYGNFLYEINSLNQYS
jgi:hypothetical protein